MYVVQKGNMTKKIHTALTAGGNSDADIATPINDPELSLNKPKATPAPDGNAINTPTHSDLNWPLKL